MDSCRGLISGDVYLGAFIRGLITERLISGGLYPGAYIPGAYAGGI